MNPSEKSLQPDWYALYTRSRHERRVASYLEGHSLQTYVPLRRGWSSRQDRKLVIESPALPGYLFVRCALMPETRALIKRHSSVLRMVESAGQPARIPARQIESLRIALAHAFHPEGHPFLKVGDRVRVVRGPMVGAEGYLTRLAENRHRLVIAVEYVNQALSVEIDAGCVEKA